MKELKRNITVEQTVLEYQAVDGTVFNDREQCRKYEGTAECAIRVAVQSLIVKTTNEYELFNGDSEHYVEIVKMTTLEDKEAIIRLFMFVNGRKELPEYTLHKINEAFENKDCLLIAWNCDRDYIWVVNTKQGLIDNLNSMCTQS